jgi:hypothetical protein
LNAFIIAHIDFERNKIFILLRSLLPKKLRPAPRRPRTHTGRSAHKIMVLWRLACGRTTLSTTSYIMRALLSSAFSSGFGPAASAFGRQLLVCQGVNQRHFQAAVVEGAPYAVDVSVLLQQFHGVNLSRTVWRCVLS